MSSKTIELWSLTEIIIYINVGYREHVRNRLWSIINRKSLINVDDIIVTVAIINGVTRFFAKIGEELGQMHIGSVPWICNNSYKYNAEWYTQQELYHCLAATDPYYIVPMQNLKNYQLAIQSELVNLTKDEVIGLSKPNDKRQAIYSVYQWKYLEMINHANILDECQVIFA